MRGHAPPGAPALPRSVDLAVVGPMARTAADLALELDVLAGPDEARDGVAYRLALPAPRHQDLKSFRVLILDTHPLLPTAASVRTALDRLGERLAKAGAKVGRDSPLLPDLAEGARLYMRLLLGVAPRRGRRSRSSSCKARLQCSRRTTRAWARNASAARS